MEVIYEDNHIIVINKVPGEIVQGDKTKATLPSPRSSRNILKRNTANRATCSAAWCIALTDL